MKKIGYKSILLILCFSMFSGALSLGFVRAVVSDGNSCYLTETIVVFDRYISNCEEPAVDDITIRNLPIKSVWAEIEAYSDRDERDYCSIRAIGFYVDGRGGAIGTRRVGPGQVRGDGVIRVGATQSWEYDLSSGCQFAKKTGTGSDYLGFIPPDLSPRTGYFSPGVHTIKACVSSQKAHSGPTQDSWISVSLHITYKFIPATIDFDPDTLNPKSLGNWVTVYIEFPECDDCSVEDIDISTILLNGVIPAEDHPTGIGDHDGDGNPDLMVKFNRTALIGSLMPGQNVDMIISGELPDGTPFEGKDIIDVLF